MRQSLLKMVDGNSALRHKRMVPYPNEIDLRWYLDGSSEAALGAKSNHASFVARMEGSSGGAATDDTDVQDHLVKSAMRSRRIADAFERCPADTQRVLTAYYRPDKLARYWRELTHLLPLLRAYDAEKHGPPDRGLGMKMGSASTTADQRAAALAIRQEADAVLSRAHEDYAALAKARPRERMRFIGC